MLVFRQTTIKRKLIALIMLTSSVALLVAFAFMIASDYLSFRSRMVRDLRTLAAVVGTNGSSALDFDDEEFATKTLAALAATPNITTAAIYTKDGRVLAEYLRDNQSTTNPNRLRPSLVRKDTCSNTGISHCFTRFFEEKSALVAFTYNLPCTK